MPGCNPTLFIVIPDEMQNGSFDSDSYRPTSDEIEQYLKNLKDNGGCQGVDALLTGHPMDSRITQVGK